MNPREQFTDTPHAQTEHISLKSFLDTLDFRVERQIPSAEAMRELEASSLFIADKISILLAALGEKPASIVGILTDLENDDEQLKINKATQVSEAQTISKRLGLATALKEDYYLLNGTPPFKIETIGVSLAASNLEPLMQAHTQQSISADLIEGKVLGFPDSAVLAFANNEELIPVGEKDTETDDIFLSFRLSKNNASEEIKTAHRWARAVAQESPFIYKAYIDAWNE